MSGNHFRFYHLNSICCVPVCPLSDFSIPQLDSEMVIEWTTDFGKRLAPTVVWMRICYKINNIGMAKTLREGLKRFDAFKQPSN